MPANLVPLVLAAVKADPNLQPGTLSPFIEGYVRDVWGPAKLGRLKEAARTKLGIGNDAKADTSQIQAVVESLTEYGWMADRFTLSGTEMQTVAVEANRGKWKFCETTRKKANKQYMQVAFDANAYKETAQCKSIIPGRQYHHGWVAAPPFFLPGNDERNGPMDEMTNKIYDSDMAHGTSPMEGVLFARVGRSANRAAMPVLLGHVIGNESTATHRIYDDFMMETCGDEFALRAPLTSRTETRAAMPLTRPSTTTPVFLCASITRVRRWCFMGAQRRTRPRSSGQLGRPKSKG